MTCTSNTTIRVVLDVGTVRRLVNGTTIGSHPERHDVEDLSWPVSSTTIYECMVVGSGAWWRSGGELPYTGRIRAYAAEPSVWLWLLVVYRTVLHTDTLSVYRHENSYIRIIYYIVRLNIY